MIDGTMRALRKSDEFKRCFKQGNMFRNQLAVLHVFERGDHDTSRVGLSVSRRIGKAVVRNRVKRWMRESLLPVDRQLRDGFDLVFSARTPSKDHGFWPLKAAMHDLLRRAGMLRQDDDGKDK